MWGFFGIELGIRVVAIGMMRVVRFTNWAESLLSVDVK